MLFYYSQRSAFVVCALEFCSCHYLNVNISTKARMVDEVIISWVSEYYML